MNKFFNFAFATLIVGLMFILASNSEAQTLMPKWSRNPYDEKTFIENKGQFASLESKLNCKILFVFEEGNTKYILIKNGFIVEESKNEINNTKGNENEDKVEDPAKEHQRKIYYSYLRFGFESI